MQLLQQMLCVMRDGMFAGSRMTLRVQDNSSGEVSHLAPGILVNAAGLQAQEVADRLKGLPAQHVPKRHLARGCYFSLSGQWQGGFPCFLGCQLASTGAAHHLAQYSSVPATPFPDNHCLLPLQVCTICCA